MQNQIPNSKENQFSAATSDDAALDKPAPSVPPSAPPLAPSVPQPSHDVSQDDLNFADDVIASSSNVILGDSTLNTPSSYDASQDKLQFTDDEETQLSVATYVDAALNTPAPPVPLSPVPPSSPVLPPSPEQPTPPVQPATYDASQDTLKFADDPIDLSKDSVDLDIGNPNLDVNFDFDGEYLDLPENKPFRPRREKRTGCVGGILYAAFILSVSFVLAALLWMGAVDVLGFGADDEAVNVTISENIELDELIDILHEAGIIRYKFLFRMYAEFSNAMDRIYPGSYILNKNYDYRAIVQGMTRRTGARVETTVTFPEGFTLAQMFILLEDHGVATAEALWEAAQNHDFNFSFLEDTTLGDRLRLEGFLFPDTYNFFLNSAPTQVINRLLREFNRRFTEEMEIRAADLGLTVREIIIIASMIEREAGSDEERARIASVIYNRLNNWNPPLLQIDATINYAIAGTDIPFSTRLDSPFNTYIHPGLPPGPIANPGMASIMAALYPENTGYYFYALNLEGTHNFFTNYADHSAFVAGPEFGG